MSQIVETYRVHILIYSHFNSIRFISSGMADHNTRTTSWQRPNSERLMHFATWQNQRSHVVSQGNQRFLYQTNQAAPTGGTPVAQDDDDGLGALPDGEYFHYIST